MECKERPFVQSVRGIFNLRKDEYKVLSLLKRWS
jgi:hypothetical protein